MEQKGLLLALLWTVAYLFDLYEEKRNKMSWNSFMFILKI